MSVSIQNRRSGNDPNVLFNNTSGTSHDKTSALALRPPGGVPSELSPSLSTSADAIPKYYTTSARRVRKKSLFNRLPRL